MRPLFFNLDSDPQLAQKLAAQTAAEMAELEMRHFPDGESYLRVLTPCQNRSVIIFCNLYQPDSKTLRLIFLAHTPARTRSKPDRTDYPLFGLYAPG